MRPSLSLPTLRALGSLATLGLLTLSGCQLIAGTGSRTTDPPPGPGCMLPSVGSGRIRVVNLGTSATGSTTSRADFCIRVSGTTDWGRPIFRDGGTDYGDASPNAENLCTQGLAYSQATVPFAVAVGKIDIMAIPAGQTCSATPTSEIDGVVVANDVPALSAPVVSIVRYGGGEKTAEKLVALPEEPGAANNSYSPLRVVNALNSGISLNFGTAAASQLPTNVADSVLTTPIAPGAAPTVQTTSLGQVDKYGYLQVLPGSLNFAVSDSSDSTNTAIALETAPANATTETFYVIGDSDNANNTFPVRGLVCQDRASVANIAGDAGPPPQETTLLQSCVATAFPSISIDAWDVALYGANAPFGDQRAPQIPLALAGRESDLICLTEVDGKTDRDNIINYMVDHGYPYSYDVDTTVDTQPTNPETLAGNVPPPPTAPPCAGISSSLLNTAYACAEQNCSSDAGTLSGSTNCIENACIDQFLPLYHPDPSTPAEFADDVCFDCILFNLDDPTETYAQGKETCTTSKSPGFVFQGQTPLLILSRHPFVKDSTKFYAYPSSGLRRGILKAGVQLEDGLTIDFFCTQLVSPQIDDTVPYVGPYGTDSVSGGPDGGAQNGWEEEQLLQAQRAVKWIEGEAATDNVPGIIAGTFYSTIARPAMGSTPALNSLSPAVMDVLDLSAPGSVGGGFTRAEPPGYQRVCDGCPENPYNGTGQPRLEFNVLFLTNFPGASTATTAESLWATDLKAVQLTAEPDEPVPPGGYGPLSVYYAHNNLIVRPK